MLIEFTIENYLSFREHNVFSMLATKDSIMEDRQIFQIDDKNRLLKNAAIYGANASGKSNLLNAIAFMKDFVINSSKESQQGDLIEVESFKFNTFSETKPSLFEVVFFHEDVIYRYGFEAGKERIESEWLFARYSSRESQLFIRDQQEIVVGNKFKEGKKYLDSVRENALYLSVCAQFNGLISSKVIKWFRNINVISSLDDNYVSATLEILENNEGKFNQEKELLVSFIKRIDLGIQDVVYSKNENTSINKVLENLPTKVANDIIEKIKGSNESISDENRKKFKLVEHTINTVHEVYDEKRNFVSNKGYNYGIESRGTQKIFELAGPIISTMINHGVLFIDEIQNSLHTKLVLGLISFFTDNKLNTKAQFIFTTHDVNILAANILRRDQFWFVDKNKYGESEMTCLVDFDEHVRKDANLDKDYLRGRYGAIPHLKNGEV